MAQMKLEQTDEGKTFAQASEKAGSDAMTMITPPEDTTELIANLIKIAIVDNPDSRIKTAQHGEESGFIANQNDITFVSPQGCITAKFEQRQDKPLNYQSLASRFANMVAQVNKSS